MSENIRVRSVVGRYLEHARVLYFENAGRPRFYISSADWMTRNLDRRVEVSVPIYDPILQSQLVEFLASQLKDSARSRMLEANMKNDWIKPRKNQLPWDSQKETYQRYKLETLRT